MKKMNVTITSGTPSSDVFIDRERDSIALSIPSSWSMSESKCRVDSFCSWWLWICEVTRRLCDAGNRPIDGRRGIAGRNCNVLLLFSIHEYI
jgi:hypothetical protein